MLSTCRGTQHCVTLCHLYKALSAFKIYFAFGRFLFHDFHDTAIAYAIEGIWFIHHCTGWFPKRKAILADQDYRIYRRTRTSLPWHYNSVGLTTGSTAAAICSLPLWHWKLCILPAENIYGLCITYVSKIKRLDLVVKRHCVFCEIGPGILNITERNFGFESVTLLLRVCFFLIWLCAKEICGGVAITLSAWLSVPITLSAWLSVPITLSAWLSVPITLSGWLSVPITLSAWLSVPITLSAWLSVPIEKTWRDLNRDNTVGIKYNLSTILFLVKIRQRTSSVYVTNFYGNEKCCGGNKKRVLPLLYTTIYP